MIVLYDMLIMGLNEETLGMLIGSTAFLVALYIHKKYKKYKENEVLDNVR